MPLSASGRVGVWPPHLILTRFLLNISYKCLPLVSYTIHFCLIYHTPLQGMLHIVNKSKSSLV